MLVGMVFKMGFMNTCGGLVGIDSSGTTETEEEEGLESMYR
jgi:hypothetical protein